MKKSLHCVSFSTLDAGAHGLILSQRRDAEGQVWNFEVRKDKNEQNPPFLTSVTC